MRLVVVLGQAQGLQLRLEERHGFSVGRSEQADLRLADPGLADIHLRAYREPEGWLAFDMSNAGFGHNGARVQRALLAPGDSLEVGSHVLRLLADGSAAPPDAAPPDGAPVRPIAATPGGAYLLATKGNDAGKTFPLGLKPAVILGRGVSTDITIWDIRASRAHARIDERQGRFVVSDLASSNGTFVNDRRLKGAHELAPGDVIRIGSTALEFRAS